MDIHDREKRLKLLWKRIEKNSSDENIAVLRRFQDELYANGLSVARILIYIEPLYLISKNLSKKLEDLGKDELKTIVAQIEKRNCSEWTKTRYKLAIKKFYSFLDGKEWNSKQYADKVIWLNTTVRKSKLKRPIILTNDEVLRIFNAARGTREKAMCSFMYESGCRCPDELLHMKIGDIEFDEYGAKVKLTSGKVGTRVIRVISCVPHLKTWVNEEHPSNAGPDSWLWVSKGTRNHGYPIGYQSLKLVVRKWRKRAGIEKKITPYTFRRTRYTHLATKMPTPLLYKFMGQVQGSKVIDRYVELNEEAVDDAVLSFYGVKHKNNGDIKPLFCSRCNRQNSPELEFCDICHAPLTEMALAEVDEKKRIEMQDMFNEMVKKFKVEMRERTT